MDVWLFISWMDLDVMMVAYYGIVSVDDVALGLALGFLLV